MFSQNTFEPEIAHCKFYGGVGLQRNPLSQTVDVETRNDGHLVGDVGLFFDDGGQGGNFDGAESGLAGFFTAFVVPVNVIFLFHAVEQTLGRYVPIYVVGVGQQHGRDIVGGETFFTAELFVVHEGKQLVLGEHKLFFHGVGKVFFRAQVVKSDAYGRYVARCQQVVYLDYVHLFGDAIGPCVDVGWEAFGAGETHQAGKAFLRDLAAHLCHDGI